MAGAVTWTSSAPDKVSVDATGHLVAKAIGSAQIFAEGAAESDPPRPWSTVAEPQAGALLVTDAQVVSVGPPLGLPPEQSPGVGTEYEVTLSGVAARPPPARWCSPPRPPRSPARSSRPGRIRRDLVVTLALAPLYQLFSAYDIALSIDLAAFPAEAVPEGARGAAPSASWNAEDRTASRAGSERLVRATDLEPFKAFDCDCQHQAPAH